MKKAISGKTTFSLHEKLLQADLRPRFENMLEAFSRKDYSPYPMAALLDVTTNCNLNCPYCIDRYALHGGELTTERLLNLLDEFREIGVRSIVYFGGGEPLLHPGISTVLQKTRELEIDFAVNTNGILLNKYVEMIADTSSWTRISLDASSSDTYNRVHGLASGFLFDRICDSVERLCTQAKGTVGVSFVVMQENISDIYAAASRVKNLGCNFAQFKPKYDTTPEGKHLAYYSDADSSRITDELEQAKEIADSEFAVLTTGSLKTLLQRKDIAQGKRYTVCAAQQLVALVNPDGVYVCPNYRGVSSKRIGDIKRSSFREMWHSDRRKQVVSNLDPSRECATFHCLRHYTNVLVNSVAYAKRQGLPIEKYLVTLADELITDRLFL